VEAPQAPQLRPRRHGRRRVQAAAAARARGRAAGRHVDRGRYRLHNFSEGLAIGQAATSGAISLAALLIVGFALHNGTEGYGIVGPRAWPWLVLAGIVGDGPTLLGTVIGHVRTQRRPDPAGAHPRRVRLRWDDQLGAPTAGGLPVGPPLIPRALLPAGQL
jgi:hypothetical protein